jgi:hypothetical protein
MTSPLPLHLHCDSPVNEVNELPGMERGMFPLVIEEAELAVTG